MKFFEAQKRAAFATKLFATVGFDFEAALKANDENALKAHTGTLDSVAALFTAAGLDHKALIAAGPDALKLHIEGLDDSAAAADLTTKLEAAQGQLTIANGRNEAFAAAFAAVGIADGTKIEAKDFKAKFDEHVQKRVALEIGTKHGHPPAHVPKADAIDDVTPKKTNTDVSAAKALTDYEALIDADNKTGTKESAKAKADFYKANHQLITRGLALRRRQ